MRDGSVVKPVLHFPLTSTTSRSAPATQRGAPHDHQRSHRPSIAGPCCGSPEPEPVPSRPRACSPRCGIKGSSAATGDTLKIGFVSPQTGALASFASSDNFVVKQITELTRKGFKSGGGTKQLQIVVKDTQSSPTRASDVTRQLITQNKVDLVVASGTPDTTNPVADACEAAGIPNVTTIAPWESWFFGRNGKDGVGFEYSTLFFFGMQQFGECFFPMWNKVGAHGKDVACLWPDDTDANAFRTGLGPAMTEGRLHPDRRR